VSRTIRNVAVPRTTSGFHRPILQTSRLQAQYATPASSSLVPGVASGSPFPD
jgi:hypothetical protein